MKKYLEENYSAQLIFDSSHLASALTVGSAVAEDFLFAGYDERLTQAASAEGLRTMPQ